MEMPLAEVVDRYSILKLKLERLVGQNNKELESTIKKELSVLASPQDGGLKSIIEKELATYGNVLREFEKKDVIVKSEWIDKLYEINCRIWDLEADIRQGKEDKLGLEEVGRRALKIRGINRERIEAKNLITKESGSGFFEIKVNHESDIFSK